jgi:hypothetical protein
MSGKAVYGIRPLFTQHEDQKGYHVESEDNPLICSDSTLRELAWSIMNARNGIKRKLVEMDWGPLPDPRWESQSHPTVRTLTMDERNELMSYRDDLVDFFHEHGRLPNREIIDGNIVYS